MSNTCARHMTLAHAIMNNLRTVLLCMTFIKVSGLNAWLGALAIHAADKCLLHAILNTS